MKSTKRALRRHHRQRMIAHAKREFGASRYSGDPEGLAVMQEWAQRNHDHLACCSCWMCGNTRKWHGPPTQERRLHAAERQRVTEWDGEPA